MSSLTRRRDPEASREERWLVYYGDVRVGAISERTGDTEPWEWRCGFYPGSEPGVGSPGSRSAGDATPHPSGVNWNDN
jgi:hypothetical protein